MQIVGKSFPTVQAFADYVATVKLGTWRPRFTVVHNTSSPDAATYLGYAQRANPISDEQWLQNLKGYYTGLGWLAGPHLFVTPKSICVFSSLDAHGTHTPSWNAISWGVETVGEFETDPFTGPVRDNLIASLAILHSAAGLAPLPYQIGVHGLHFHREDARTTHRNCPGKNMVKSDLVAAVVAKMAEMHAGDHIPGSAA